MKNRKVLLLGAISPFCDLVNEIESLGMIPVVCDYYEDAPAKQMGYKAYDISTMDVDALLKVAKDEGIDGVVSAFSDRNLLPAMDLCDALGLDYYFNRDIVNCLTDKMSMKAEFAHHHNPVIKYGIFTVDELEENLCDFVFPVVTKPLDAYGSKGIFVCRNIEEVKSVATRVLKESLKYSDRIIIEEFYDADEISVSAWVKDGQSFVTCIYDVVRNFGDDIALSAVSFPSKYTKDHLDNIIALTQKVVTEIGIENGPVTLQCFLGDRGIMVSELLCRLAGGSPYLYSTYLGGPNLAKMVIQNAVGDDIDYQNLHEFRPEAKGDEIYYAIQIMVAHKGTISYEFNVDEVYRAIEEIVDLRVHYKSGSKLINCGKGGVVFAKAICKTTRDADYCELISRIDSAINVLDENGDKVSFIVKPNKLEVKNTYDIDWRFLENYDDI